VWVVSVLDLDGRGGELFLPHVVAAYSVDFCIVMHVDQRIPNGTGRHLGKIRVNSDRESLPPTTVFPSPQMSASLKQIQMDLTVTLRTHGVEPRCMQTSGSEYLYFQLPIVPPILIRRGS